MEYKQFPEIEQQRIYDGVKAWHDAGFRGQGVNVWNTESNTEHSEIVTRRIYDSAPDCKVYQAGLTLSTVSGKVVATCNYDGKEYDIEEFIKQCNIKAVTRSIGGGTAIDTIESNWWKNLQDKYNLLICNSAGNEASEGCGGSIPPDVALYIGACNLVKGTPKRDWYSSIGEEIDFVDFRGIWSGSSFASPYYLGIGILFKSRFNINMTQQEIFKLTKMICLDMEEVGYDIKTGWGLPILPNVNKRYITMTTKAKCYQINGQEKQMDTLPINKDGTVFVPVRFIAEELGCTVDAKFNEDKTIKVIITKGDKEIILNTNSDIAFIKKDNYYLRDYLNFAPYIDENNRTLVPVRFVSEQFNCKVDWVQKDSKVMILEN